MPPESYRAIFEANVPARMRDGVTLYADVWRPEAPGRFPVLLTRTPYDKQQAHTLDVAGVNPMRAVGQGYAVIYQDTRGRFTSEGDWAPFVHEFDDGYDTVEWAAGLPFCDGNVGMFGISYLALTQWSAAITRPPHLRAIFPQQMGDGAGDFIYPGSAFALGGALNWALGQAVDVLLRRARSGEDVNRLRGPLLSALDDVRGATDALPLKGAHWYLRELDPSFELWIDRVENASERDLLRFSSRVEQIAVPAYSLGGWYDIYCGPTPALFSALRERGGSDVARRGQKLLVGPWAHAVFGDAVGELNFGMRSSLAALDITGLHLRWFDYWLKGIDNGVMTEPPVRIFVMGDNAWRREHEWPLARTQWTRYYLHGGGKANSAGGDGALSTEAPSTAEPPDHYLYDPRDPVPTVGGCTLLPGSAVGANAGPKDQFRVEARPDVLVYTSPVLGRDVEATGPITMTLFAASNAPDTDWTAKLVDVWPDGRAYNLADGVIRARYRDGIGAPALLEPGRVYEYTIDLEATSNVFKAGHRIRVQVSSSNYPRFSRNPNTGRDIATETELVPALQTVFHDAEHPSHITLPVIPRAAG